MSIDPTILSSISALLGATVGGGASLAGAVYTQRNQDRIQRIARESAKREAVYAEFIMAASSALLNAYLEDGLTFGQDQQRLLGLLQRMRLFAPRTVMQEAETMARKVFKVAMGPRIDPHKLTTADLAERSESDVLEAFGRACRSDLDDLRLRIR
jgi:hypothetical protein